MGCRPATRVAPGVAPAAELLEIETPHARLLDQLAPRRSLDIAVARYIDEPARQRPLARERLSRPVRPLDQQQLEPAVDDRENRQVHGAERPREGKIWGRARRL